VSSGLAIHGLMAEADRTFVLSPARLVPLSDVIATVPTSVQRDRRNPEPECREAVAPTRPCGVIDRHGRARSDSPASRGLLPRDHVCAETGPADRKGIR
jgi:hypothetical protein